MHIPVQVSFHGVDHSDSVKQKVHDKVAKLGRFCPDIISCRVTIGKQRKSPHVEYHKGEPFQVGIDVAVPGDVLVVQRGPHESDGGEDIAIALRDAFEAMSRKVRSYADRRRA
ncbi:ribosome-associated translation inhibitor RaiA [Haematospirillum jordaniae]|uniref:Ribose ABC transporter permease n=1 Tax=Haematospirillum jordaniae TaxID=1549855 RepID=A0A143DBD0_9PROT|nr:HPF/RaiA family ribosome-associated protein [Haematospirillum jordaniae]AMW34051.1 ribose ABC transporter permease [Haematospirillum jordaniae]NKD45320.1 ribosome-associated translation inhibitor RaiA [Haematospirillum jordaniae]NKD57312.1 ribosome-associated translation inhibitor RaiA [Haematospirillum jordaniae]NKD59666.1 ribosome-associated translation inhibitor RaiA [Haematospirillum jordaniae]NKD67238.1 ribosome-associated translation inhibitor RaiA [Haematospirillum jordaniae]